MQIDDSDKTSINKKEVQNGNGNGNNIEKKVKIGDIIGGCELIELIGKGGMGAVYKARQVSLDKTIALKILSPKYWNDELFIESFMSEARIAAKIEHQNVVHVYDTGTDRGIPYILMQFVSGKTLRQIERERRISFDDLLDYFIQACKGLICAHSQKVVHRDIKPENLIITDDGYLKITDFGLAKHEKDIPDELPTNGKIMASASFMSPEQADLHPIDVRSDLYSLGVTFYSLFSGSKPFTGDSHLELVLRHHLDPPECATLKNRDIPLSLSAIFHKLMRKRPVFRYQSVNALIADLVKIKAYQYPKNEQTWRFESFAVSTIDASSIKKRGIGVCIRAQKESKAKNQPFSNLGEMMHAKDYLRIIKPSEDEKKMPEDLPFLIPKELKLPDNQADTSEISLTNFISDKTQKRDAKNEPIYKLRRSGVEIDFIENVLILYIRDNMRDVFKVQHFYDLLDHFPYPLDFKVQLVFDTDLTLDNSDIRWLIDSHNLINRKKGQLTVCVKSDVVEDFINKNNLSDFLEVEYSKKKTIEGSFRHFSDVINAVVDEVVEEVDLFDLESQIELQLDNQSEDKMTEQNNNEKEKKEIIDELEFKDEEEFNQTKEDKSAEKEKVSENLKEKELQILEKINVGDFESAFRLAKKFIISGKPISSEMAETLEKIGRKYKFEGEELLKKEDYDGAKLSFEKALEVRNNDADAYYLKGVCLKKLGKLSSSIEFINAAIDLNPQNANFFYNRAIIKSRMKKIQESIDDLSKAVDLNPNHANAFYNRGIAYEKLREYAKALADYKKALNLNPDYRKILTPRLKKIALELEKNS